MSQNRYAVFLDLDGTLIARNSIPPRNKDVIAAARRSGHAVFLNTGRSKACIPAFVLDELPLDGLVAGIGSYITVADELLYCTVIPRPLLEETAALLWQHGYPHVYEGEDKMLYANMASPAWMPHAFILDGPPDLAGPYRDERITKATIIGQLAPDDLEALSESFTVFQHDTYAEIAMKGHSKADGMHRVLDHLGLARSQSIAIGDSANDEDMLRAAGISVAMGNATESIKALCDEITADAADAGVALALERLLHLGSSF